MLYEVTLKAKLHADEPDEALNLLLGLIEREMYDDFVLESTVKEVKDGNQVEGS